MRLINGLSIILYTLYALANANVLFIILYKFYVQDIYISTLQVSLANALSTSSITCL